MNLLRALRNRRLCSEIFLKKGKHIWTRKWRNTSLINYRQILLNLFQIRYTFYSSNSAKSLFGSQHFSTSEKLSFTNRISLRAERKSSWVIIFHMKFETRHRWNLFPEPISACNTVKEVFDRNILKQAFQKPNQKCLYTHKRITVFCINTESFYHIFTA